MNILKFKKSLLLLCWILASISASYAQQLNVASYNIRYDNPQDAQDGNGWSRRCPVVCQLINYHDFDIVGAQEVLENQLIDMQALLPGYGYVGVGRNDGKTKGEYAPIFYKKSRIKLLNSGVFWLAESTERPNKGWDAAFPRICTWAEFRDVVTNKKFYFLNTHFDHKGVVARRESCRLIIRKIEEIAKNHATIVTGDFNVDQHNESYSIFTKDDKFKDSFSAARIKHANNGTTNRFDINSHTESRIDHIFVSPSIDIVRYAILTDCYWVKNAADPSGKQYKAHTPSDHFPVSIQLILK